MGIIKSGKLEMDEATSDLNPASMPFQIKERSTETIKIRPIECCNDWIAVLQFHIDTELALPSEGGTKTEGIVIGVGPGMPTANGLRCPSQLKIGDVVTFADKAVVRAIASDSPPYKDQLVVILNERNVFCKLQPVPFELVD